MIDFLFGFDYLKALIVVLIIVALAVFQKKGTAGGKVMGILCLVVGSIGVFIIAYGMGIIVATIALTGSGDDYTGLGIIVGPMIMLPGFVLAIPFSTAIRLLELKSKYTAIIVVLLCSYPAISTFTGIVTSQEKGRQWRQEQLDREQSYELEYEKIFKEFKANDFVLVEFHFTYEGYSDFAKKVRNVTAQTRGDLNKEFVINNIINPMGEENVRRWTTQGDYTIVYYIELTKAGYEMLRNHPNVKWIKLWKE